MSIEEYTSFLIKSICKEEEKIEVDSTMNDDKKIITVSVPESMMGVVLGSSGKNIKAIRTLVNVYAYQKNVGYVEVLVTSF